MQQVRKLESGRFFDPCGLSQRSAAKYNSPMDAQLTLNLFGDEPQDTEALLGVCEQAVSTPVDLESAAQALYDAGQTPRPSWSHLGEVTRSVWREYAQLIAQGVPDPFSVRHQQRPRG